MTPPGSGIRRLAARWCSANTMERVIDPAVADMQAECDHARRNGQPWRWWWIWITSHAALVKALLKHGSLLGVDMVTEMGADDRSIVMRAVLWATGAILAVTIVIAASPLVHEVSRGRVDLVHLSLLLVPQALPLAIPVGVIVGVLFAFPQGQISRSARVWIVTLAVAASAASFALMGWIIPQTNQTFR